MIESKNTVLPFNEIAKATERLNQKRKLSVTEAAELMNVGPQFVRVGLQKGILPIGTAMKVAGNRYTYYISPKLFEEYTGIKVNE